MAEVPPAIPPPTVRAELRDTVDSTDTSARYLGYLGRLRPIITAWGRYVAYSSDVGEAFRPVAHPHLVKFLYMVSWAYVFGDVGYVTYHAQKAGLNNEKLTRVAGERFVFQAIASLLAPALIIHSAVSAVTRATATSSPTVRKFAPSAIGLAIVPMLPYIVDEPAEHVVEGVFQHLLGPNPFPLHYIHDSAPPLSTAVAAAAKKAE